MSTISMHTPLSLFKWFFNLYYKMFPPEMLQYWKRAEAVEAVPIMAKDGSYQMRLRGEKYPIPGFPRGHVLMGPLAELKKLVKNEIFNRSWALLDEKKDTKEIIDTLLETPLPAILRKIETLKLHMVPPEHMLVSTRELHRALTAVKGLVPAQIRSDYLLLRDGITFFLQEDDAYRYRMQWISPFVNPKAWWRRLIRLVTFRKYSLFGELKLAGAAIRNAEVTEDMKLRINLIERVVSALAHSPEAAKLINAFMEEVDWKKLKLSKQDKYHFRAKYFKVDHALYDY